MFVLGVGGWCGIFFGGGGLFCLFLFKSLSLWAETREAFLDLCVSFPLHKNLVRTMYEQLLQEDFVAAFNQRY